MKCPNCGMDMAADALFCAHCGTPLNQQPMQQAAPEESGKTPDGEIRGKTIIKRLITIAIGIYDVAAIILLIMGLMGKFDGDVSNTVAFVVCIIIVSYAFFGIVAFAEKRYYARHPYTTDLNLFTILQVVGLILSIIALVSVLKISSGSKSVSLDSDFANYIELSEDELVELLHTTRNESGVYPDEESLVFVFDNGRMETVILSTYSESVFPGATIHGAKVGMSQDQVRGTLEKAGCSLVQGSDERDMFYDGNEYGLLVHYADGKADHLIFGIREDGGAAASSYDADLAACLGMSEDELIQIFGSADSDVFAIENGVVVLVGLSMYSPEEYAGATLFGVSVGMDRTETEERLQNAGYTTVYESEIEVCYQDSSGNQVVTVRYDDGRVEMINLVGNGEESANISEGMEEESVYEGEASLTTGNGEEYIGEWYGYYYDRCHVSITKDTERNDSDQFYYIEVNWGSSATENTHWYFYGQYGETSYGYGIAYEGACYDEYYTEDGMEEVARYMDGAGVFYMDESGRLYWEDYIEGTASDDYFVKD